jgi:hypothetical protein
MNELTDAQRDALKTLPPSYLAKLRAAVTHKKELDFALAEEEARVAKLRDMIQDWKAQHDAAYESAMLSIQARLDSSSQGVSQAVAHSDKTKQIQITTLEEQIARRRTEISKIDQQTEERQAKIDETRAAIAELHASMEKKRSLIDALHAGVSTPRLPSTPFLRRPAMTLYKADGKARPPTLASAILSPRGPAQSVASPRGSAFSPRATIFDQEKEEVPQNSSETADPIGKIDIDTVPARVVLEAFLEIILDPACLLVNTLGNVAKANELDKLGKAWVEIFADNGELMTLLKQTIEREVAGTLDLGTLFRSNSMASRMMSAFSRSIGMDYLRSLLKPKIDAIIALKENLEIDSMKLAGDQVEAQRETVVVSPALIDSNVTKLTEHAIDFIQTIMAGKAKAPLEYYQISALLKDVVSKKFPEQWKIAIGGYLFLRLMCPTIFLPPDEFGIQFDTVAPEAKRTLVLVSKILQNLANLNPKFGEEVMAPFSSFVTFNMHSVAGYFEYMSNIPSSLHPSPLPDYPIRQRLREVLTIAATNYAKLAPALLAVPGTAPTEQYIQLWTFNEAPKLLVLYNKLTNLANVLPYHEDNPDVITFINLIVPPKPTVAPIMNSASVSMQPTTPATQLPMTTPVTPLQLSTISPPSSSQDNMPTLETSATPNVLLAILETSTRLDFSGVENSELAAALFPIWEYRSQTPTLMNHALDIFLTSPTRSNRTLLESVAAKIFIRWNQFLIPPLAKTILAPAIFSMVSKKETLSRREELCAVATQFLDAILGSLPEMPISVFQTCHSMSMNSRLGVPCVVEFLLSLIWVKALEDPESYSVPSGGGDRAVKKALLMVADILSLVAIGAKDKQNAAMDTFLTTSHTRFSDAVRSWLTSMKCKTFSNSISWNTVSEGLDDLRIFLGKNMSSVSTILEHTTSVSRYVKFTVPEAIAVMVKHAAAKTIEK